MRRHRQLGEAIVPVLVVVGIIGGTIALFRWRPNAVCAVVKVGCSETVLGIARDTIAEAGPDAPPEVVEAFGIIEGLCPTWRTACDGGTLTAEQRQQFGEALGTLARWVAGRPRSRAIGAEDVDWEKLAERAEKLERKAARELAR